MNDLVLRHLLDRFQTSLYGASTRTIDWRFRRILRFVNAKA